jgi:hypothetical protein
MQPHITVDRNKKYTTLDFRPYVKRNQDWDNRTVQPLPNLTPISLKEALNRIAVQPTPTLHGYIELERRTGWGTLWLDTLQSGNFNGVGTVVLPMWGEVNPICCRFALCLHEDQLLPHANPGRGLHDKFCIKCGLDTSYDSSG